MNYLIRFLMFCLFLVSLFIGHTITKIVTREQEQPQPVSAQTATVILQPVEVKIPTVQPPGEAPAPEFGK